ncbi:unnamed protein product [Staurois parvus]|uniref:Uncharacterized protein n=1 Tax=Staurois parvus TaxID=386267 RepID=A0ABN9AQP8_9NEOB|nr:unnamed protein product [Staurois parvus]
MVSVGGIVPHHWFHCDTNDGTPLLVSVGGIMPHHWCQWEE